MDARLAASRVASISAAATAAAAAADAASAASASMRSTSRCAAAAAAAAAATSAASSACSRAAGEREAAMVRSRVAFAGHGSGERRAPASCRSSTAERATWYAKVCCRGDERSLAASSISASAAEPLVSFCGSSDSFAMCVGGEELSDSKRRNEADRIAAARSAGASCARGVASAAPRRLAAASSPNPSSEVFDGRRLSTRVRAFRSSSARWRAASLASSFPGLRR